MGNVSGDTRDTRDTRDTATSSFASCKKPSFLDSKRWILDPVSCLDILAVGAKNDAKVVENVTSVDPQGIGMTSSCQDCDTSRLNL